MTCLRCLALASLWLASSSWGWGQEGHRISGMIAQQLLSERARAEVAALLPDADFAELALYMDRYKPLLRHTRPGSEQWHYNDQPVCGDASAEVCPGGNCASQQIARLRLVLADRAAGRNERIEALTFLLHLVGDVHQPLHAADNHDHGGNQIRVWLPDGVKGKARNLHAVWDVTLVQMLLAGEAEASWVARTLPLARRQQAAWQTGTVAAWIDESNQYARRQVYAPLGFRCGLALPEPLALTPQYLQASLPLVQQQLLKAGVRAAAVINQALR